MAIDRFSTVLAVLAFAAGVAQVSAGAEHQKAAEILARARKATGGGTIDSLKTLSVEGTLRRNIGTMQATSDVEVLLELPDKYVRTDVPARGMGAPMTVGFNGETVIRPAGSMVLPGGGMMIRIGPGGPVPPTEKLPPDEQARADEAMLRSSRADLSRLMLGWFALTHPALQATYTYVGEAESPDGKAHVVEATADGFTARLFLDQQTHLPLMVTYMGPRPRIVAVERPRGGGGRRGGGDMTAEERRTARDEAARAAAELQTTPPETVEHTLFFDDWRETGGVRFPHTMRRASGGTTTEEWIVTRVRINPRIDSKKFAG